LRYLAPSSHTTVSNPFAPISGLSNRIEAFRASLSGIHTKDTFSAKLPAIPLPTFDGSDFENFLKEFERWLRLSGIQESPDQLKIDWLIQACSPKVKTLVEKVVQ
jgi:hypothetical protein